jgi:hypothetical protein
MASPERLIARPCRVVVQMTEQVTPMKTFMLFTSGGPLVILTSYASVTEPGLIEKLKAKGIDKFMAFEIDVEKAQDRYGGHFAVVMHDVRETDDLRVLDFDGQRAFKLFPFDDLSKPIFHEAG